MEVTKYFDTFLKQPKDENMSENKILSSTTYSVSSLKKQKKKYKKT